MALDNRADYQGTWASVFGRRVELNNKRIQLEIEMNEVQNEIAHLDEILAHLAPLAGHSFGAGSIAGLGITDAIRSVLSEQPLERLSAADVLRKLKEKDFNFNNFAFPMASIYKILARLRDGQEVEVEKEDRKVFYTWKVKIEDEDIPF